MKGHSIYDPGTQPQQQVPHVNPQLQHPKELHHDGCQMTQDSQENILGHILAMIPDLDPNPKYPMGILSYSMLKNHTIMGVK